VYNPLTVNLLSTCRIGNMYLDVAFFSTSIVFPVTLKS